MLSSLRKDIASLANKEKIAGYQRYFKTGKGEYGEGDIFIGLTVPQSRILAKKYRDLSTFEITQLLHSKIHEERQIALMILVLQFVKGSEQDPSLLKLRQARQKKIYDFYVKNIKYINNWDLIDGSAPQIIGAYLFQKSHSGKSETMSDVSRIRKDRSWSSQDDGKNILYQFARSDNLWKKRIAIVSTYRYIKTNSFENTLAIAEILIGDTEDLIQKAVGWMLREVGNRNREVEEEFLKKHYKNMGRTALRYAIEKFPESLRKSYLLGKI